MLTRTNRLAMGIGIVMLAGTACVVALADTPTPPVNMEQLTRILRGETIAERGDEDEFTDEFFIEECRFKAQGDNMFFPLQPGHQLYLAGDDEGEFVELYITVLKKTKEITLTIDGKKKKIKTRIVEEREFKDGELVEISKNYFAVCEETGDVMYFGEDVCFFEDDVCVGMGGSWLAGKDGATPGVLMPGRFLLGARYYQEVAPGIAEDRGENIAMGETFLVPAGEFEECAVVLETTPLEPDAEDEKVYAPEIGLIKDGVLELVSYHLVDDDNDK